VEGGEMGGNNFIFAISTIFCKAGQGNGTLYFIGH